MKNLSESILHELTESTDLTARVTYHSEDGTRDYIAGKLSDGRYFLIGQQERITVSDKDLPKLAKKNMNDFRYDEDRDKEFIGALKNGTTLDKNSDLAKIIINASRKHLDDGCYLLSESAGRKAKKLKEEKAYPRVSPEFEEYDKIYGSFTNDDAVDTLDELIRYFSDFSAEVKRDSFAYQGANSTDLDRVVSLLKNARATLDNMWGN